MFFNRLEIFLDRIINAKVDHLKASAFHHHADEVFADVVNVALNGTDHHLADLRRAGLGEQRTKQNHARFHCVGRHQHFWNEQNTIAEIDADDAHAFDERLRQNVVRRPFTAKKNVDTVNNFLAQTIIEVIMHLLDEFVVGKRVQIKIAVGHA